MSNTKEDGRTSLDVARQLVADGSIVVQTASLVAGVPVRVYSPGEYVDFAGNRLDVAVLQFEEGHAFVILEKREEFDALFVQLTPEVAKVFGEFEYIQDRVLPGMCHGLVLRPPTLHAQAIEDELQALQARLAAQAGVLHVHRDGLLLGVDDEPQALQPLLSGLPLIAIDFPSFRDGRGYIRRQHSGPGDHVELLALMDLLAGEPRLMPHLHLSLQQRS